jgi:aspartyl-tRNA(Asn)/glutamyl-tRNA(Gln) amidotransferase subunit C
MDVKYVAELAKIKLTPEEANKLQLQLDNIFSFFKELENLNTDNIEPLSHVLDVKNVFREDIPRESINKKEILDLAPQKNDNFVKVPKVVG